MNHSVFCTSIDRETRHLHIRLPQHFDVFNHEAFKDCVETYSDKVSIPHVVLDLRYLVSIDIATIALLLSIMGNIQQLGGTLRFTNITSTARAVFKAQHAIDFLNQHADV